MEELVAAAAAASYWLAVGLWLAIIAMLLRRLWRPPAIDRTTAFLIVILAVDAGRTLIENLYFGLYWGSIYGVLSPEVALLFGRPSLAVLPKLLNIAVAVVILCLLLCRWLPRVERERAATAAALVESRRHAELVATAFSAVATPISVVDAGQADLPVVFANRAFREMFGAGPWAWPSGGPAWGIVPGDAEAAATLAGLRRAIEAGTTASAVVRTADTPPRWLQVNVSSSVDRLADGTRPGVATFRDVTTRREAEARLARRSRLEALGQLTGGIAHDFNNLLSVVEGNAELAEAALADRTEPKLVEAREAAATIRAAGERGAALVHRLLAFARQEPLADRPFAVDPTMRALEPLLLTSLGSAVTLDLDLAAPGAMVRCDPSRLENAVINLCINARDAMPAGGRVAVATTCVAVSAEAAERIGDLRPGPHVAIRIADTGEGMTPQILERAFDPFFTTKAGRGGTGLGLSTVYGFVRQAGGGIEIASTPGQGTEVTLWLPAAEDEPVAGRR